ncbi:MAG TPA: FAD:protein FMN transferase [Sphingomonas sp.]|jgi:thiamine biosynthesis lipoprotein|uniref:FAD:protein FMN transferase n=1 Tax=Sphingomonas sp. TaxID=28214 RepID=UPI002ED86205
MRIALPPRIDAGALADRDPTATLVDLGGETMGTSWSVRLAATPGFDGAAVFRAIKARLGTIVAEMSHWSPASDLSRFNRAPGGRWVSLAPDFAHVMAAALDIAARTGGAFDPAIGAIVDIWGFGPVAIDAPPDAAAIDAARGVSGWHRLAFDPGARRLHQPGGLALDLSGIAKGHAVDMVADLLQSVGIRHCLVEIGGELVGRGVRPDGDPWWVDLESPPNMPLPPLRIALHGLAVATSGNYRRGAHTLDPRTGYPVDGDMLSVSVIHDRAMLADAWATALTVASNAAELAAAAEIAARIVTIANGHPHEHITPALTAMLADDG